MAADRSIKDKEMASRLKREGVTRNVMKCPMCHRVVSINGLFSHLSECGRKSPDKAKISTR